MVDDVSICCEIIHIITLYYPLVAILVLLICILLELDISIPSVFGLSAGAVIESPEIKTSLQPLIEILFFWPFTSFRSLT